ncbi:hypothetical protein V2J09_007762 [Rumex salicifolius]
MTTNLQLCILLILFFLSVANAKSPKFAMPNCNDTCGGIKIPYPFGMGASNCFLDPWFEIDCRALSNRHNKSNHKPFISKLDIQVLYFDLFPQIGVLIPPLSICTTPTRDQSRQLKSVDLTGSPYNYQAQDHVFMMEGCPGSAVLFDQTYTTAVGCGTVCHGVKNRAIPTNGCFGVNCCQTPLTSNDHSLDYSNFPFYEIEFILQPSEVEHCLVGSLIQSASVNAYVGQLSRYFPPVVLQWNWPDGFDRPRSHRHSTCYSSFFDCTCDLNYKGSPYLPDGCQPPEGCEGCNGDCHNQLDSSGDAIKDKYYCERRPLIRLAAILGLSNSFGLLLVAACVYGLYRFVKRRRETKRRAKFFKRNGGLLLNQQLASNGGIVERTKIFTISELDKATDHFNENRILGQGGQGTVYKGMLTDGSIVAIKKAKLLDETQLEQFINEVVILSRINHRHVVKLFGCCLETEVPLLVYEFIPNGTLFEHIHDPDEDFAVSWEMRLKIAADSAGAIAYLHSSSSIPIYHRDIKSSNILLDEKYRAKVSDFGSSKTIAMDQTHLTTLVQGTMGYLDPEYFQSYQFTEKSDVYSFGVVVLELLTSKKPIYREGNAMEQKNLVTEFLFLTQDSRVSNILDPKIVEEAKEDELISVVELAKRCVNWSGKLRPTMKEVAMTLEMIIKSPEQVSSWYQQQEDITNLYARYDEFDMDGASDADFIWTTLPSGVASPPSGSNSPPPGPSLTKQGCQQKCGKAVIAYPFGIGSRCYHNKWFEITCDNSSTPAKAFLTKLNLEVLRIRLRSQTVKINMPMIFNCTKGVAPWTSLDLGGTPFSFSRRYNVFAPVNCNGSSFSYYENRVMASCGPPVCENASDLDEGFPDGVFPFTFKGVCRANSPPYGLTYYSVNITESNGSCSYVGLAESDPTTGYQFNLSAASLQKEASIPVVINWLYDLLLDPLSSTFQNGRCDLNAYLDNGLYSCSCPNGQVGNPFLPNACHEAEECASCDGTCIVLEVDSYNVSIKFDCLSDSHSWKKRHPWAIPVIIGASVAIGSVLLLLGCYWLYRLIERWKEIRKKAINFKRNGGLLLHQQISSDEGSIEGAKVFTSNELDTATDHFNKNRILGQGGQGTVYKGMLIDGRIIAVKKALKLDANQSNQFINEMVILSHINHRNIVKLLGCCLETDVPLLVYEYVPNGTLYHHIHEPTDEFPITWKMRLQIATDVAEAIAYLHSASSIPIFHRDIKSSNILLDEKYKPKVSDFGTSRTNPVDQTHLTTGVKGTFGYVDPEYFQTNQLTEKSDVYSFGVVLVELLTGQKPVRSDNSGDERGLAAYFLSSLESSSLSEIVDSRIVKECSEDQLMAYCSLAKRCLHLHGKHRPTMKEVVMVLEGIKLNKDLGNNRLVASEVEEMDYIDSSTNTMSLTEFAMVEELAFLIKDNLPSKHLVLSVEEALVNFLQDDARADGILELQPMDSYHRLLVHRLAEIFGFAHESIGEGSDRHIVLKCCPETSLPSILVSDILYQQDMYQSPPTPHEILKRDDGSRVLKIKSARTSTTLEEREEAYLAARCRIFSMADDDDNPREAIRQRPRHVPAAAQRMIAHALGQRINPSSPIRGMDRGKFNADSKPPESEGNCQGHSEGPTEAISGTGEQLESDKPCSKDCNKASNTKSAAISANGNGSHSIDKMKRENLGAAKRMFTQALGIQSSRKMVSPSSGK